MTDKGNQMRIEYFGKPMVSAKWRTMAIIGWAGWTFQYFVQFIID